MTAYSEEQVKQAYEEGFKAGKESVVDKPVLCDGADYALKPCPFCGSHEIELQEVKLRVAPNHWQVKCLSCGCGTLRYSYYALPTEQCAISRWNSRAFA